MATRPKGDMDSLVVPKAGQPEIERDEPPAAVSGMRGHTLSLRLTGEQYRRLRRFAAAQEDQRGSRVTHQEIIEGALNDYMDRHGG